MMLTEIRVAKAASWTKNPATTSEKKALRIKNMAKARVRVPRRGTAIRLAAIVTSDTRSK